MTSVTSKNPLSTMLDNDFSKFDRNNDDALDSEEFQSFNEILKPGIALDANGKPTTDYSIRMDHNSDCMITRQEMETTGVLMPASLTDPTLGKMWDYLSARTDDPAAQAAAAILKENDNAAA